VTESKLDSWKLETSLIHHAHPCNLRRSLDTMLDAVGKKRLRHATHEDVSSEKKLKSITTTTTTDRITPERHRPTGTSEATMAAVNKNVSTPTIHKAAFGSPIPSNKHQKHLMEATPFSSKPTKKVSELPMGNATLPAQGEIKADVTAGADSAVVTEQEETVAKIVYRVSWVWTTLLFFLWIGSSAVLGGLLLREKLNHEMHVFQLKQEILDPVSPSAEVSKKDEKDFLDLLEVYKTKAMESEAKLQGCKQEFLDSLTRLERN
jgi:hypothetical protein